MLSDIQPTTLLGVKRLANQLKKTEGISHSVALDRAAERAGFTNYRNALRNLDKQANDKGKNYIFLSIYWENRENNVSRNATNHGRETLKIELSKPVLDLCSKHELKRVRGFEGLRMVAEDHFISDRIAVGQDYARERLCLAKRSLQFIEVTGLRPFSGIRNYPRVLISDPLPFSDHSSDWIDPASGQFILVDEPYGLAIIKNGARANWAERNGWQIQKSSWAGIHNPYSCEFYICSQKSSIIDLDALIKKVNSLDEPMIAENWNGISENSWKTFLSPMAKTKNDRRRARCKDMIYTYPSKATIPMYPTQAFPQRRPSGEIGVEGHIKIGRIIKATIHSQFRTPTIYRHMNSMRSNLENWMSQEIGKGKLEGEEFFDVYYRSTKEDQLFQQSLKTKYDFIASLLTLEKMLVDAYPDCAPLRNQLKHVRVSISLLRKVK